MIKISLVDDDPSDRSFLHSLVSGSFEKTDIAVEISEFESAEDFLSVFEPEIFDLCFLDIYMKKMNGMDAARQIRELDPELAIVFLTSSADYVYEGYEVQALRYLTKPPVPEKVHAVIDQFLAQTVLKNRRLAVSSGKQNYEVPYGKILYIMSVGNNIELHLKDTCIRLSARHTFTKTIEPLLQDFRFISCARGVVVNLAHVKALEKDRFLMDNGAPIPISRRQYAAVNDAYIDFQFEHML